MQTSSSGSLHRLYLRVRQSLPAPLREALDVGRGVLRGRILLRHADLLAAIARRRVDRHRLFVGWVLDGDENDGAARVRGLIPHSYLRSRGVHSVILRKPAWTVPFSLKPWEMDLVRRAGFDVVVFQRVAGPHAESLARGLSTRGTRTVWAVGDLTPAGMPEVVDRVVVASDGLKELAAGYLSKVTLIESVIETPPGLAKDYSKRPTGGDLKVVWVGYPRNLHLLAPVREALSDPRLRNYRLVVISRGPEATYQWDRRRVWRQILDCDIAVLPSIETDWYQAKPNTRMIMFKALGIPMVASPVPSHAATLEHGRSCYFARTVEEWVRYLAVLADPGHRREIGLADRDKVLSAYGVEAVGHRWLGLLEELAGRRQANQVPATPGGR